MVSYEDRIKNPGLYSSNSSYEERVKNPGLNNSSDLSLNNIELIFDTNSIDELWFKYNNDANFRINVNSNIELRNKFIRICQSYIDNQTTRLR